MEIEVEDSSNAWVDTYIFYSYFNAKKRNNNGVEFVLKKTMSK